jgi:hypothetical protein
MADAAESPEVSAVKALGDTATDESFPWSPTTRTYYRLLTVSAVIAVAFAIVVPFLPEESAQKRRDMLLVSIVSVPMFGYLGWRMRRATMELPTAGFHVDDTGIAISGEEAARIPWTRIARAVERPLPDISVDLVDEHGAVLLHLHTSVVDFSRLRQLVIDRFTAAIPPELPARFTQRRGYHPTTITLTLLIVAVALVGTPLTISVGGVGGLLMLVYYLGTPTAVTVTRKGIIIRYPLATTTHAIETIRGAHLITVGRRRARRAAVYLEFMEERPLSLEMPRNLELYRALNHMLAN